jgi:glyoxalase family protein
VAPAHLPRGQLAELPLVAERRDHQVPAGIRVAVEENERRTSAVNDEPMRVVELGGPTEDAAGLLVRRLDVLEPPGGPQSLHGALLSDGKGRAAPPGPRVIEVPLTAKPSERKAGVRLNGVHHVTAITGDAPRNVDFYTRVLGLRLVKKTVNQDDPTVYHLFYADKLGSAGSDLTFFEYPGARRGRAGAGMVHRVGWRIGSDEALRFWEQRLSEEGVEVAQSQGRLRFEDPEGMGLELAVVETADEPLVAEHPEIPPEHALQGFDGVRAFATDPEPSRSLLEEALGFTPRAAEGWDVRGELRGSYYAYDPPPAERGFGGAGTVHHVAWASTMEDHPAWQQRLVAAGAQPTPVIDRFYFRSIYFREPSGVLFEIATIGPGFAVDEPLESLGESLALPPRFEPYRAQLEELLTPLPEPVRR